jgi:WD40 repeat protein
VTTGSAQRAKKWSCKYSLSGHLSEVIDLKWSSNTKYLVSAGMDKRIIVWYVEKSRYERILEEHQKFVQGIAVDDKFNYIISMSNDRSAKVWKNSNTKKTEVAFFGFKTFKKIDFPKESKEKEKEKESNEDEKS